MSYARTYDFGPKPLPISRNKKVITKYTNINQAMSLDQARRWITLQKAEKSAMAMDKLSANDQWPKDQADVRAYLGNSDSNRFKNVEMFFKYTKKNPLLYQKRWRFEPNDVMNAEKLKEAGDFVFYRARQYSTTTGHIRTGTMFQGLMYLVKPVEGATPKPFFGDIKVQRSTELWIASVTEYASSVEAHSVERARTGGIMFQAAKDAKARYKGLVVQYTYTSLEKLGLPPLHHYAIPVIRIGFRGKTMKSKNRSPGRNIRRRRTMKKKKKNV